MIKELSTSWKTNIRFIKFEFIYKQCPKCFQHTPLLMRCKKCKIQICDSCKEESCKDYFKCHNYKSRIFGFYYFLFVSFYLKFGFTISQLQEDRQSYLAIPLEIIFNFFALSLFSQKYFTYRKKNHLFNCVNFLKYLFLTKIFNINYKRRIFYIMIWMISSFSSRCFMIFISMCVLNFCYYFLTTSSKRDKLF
jgi:hypothetical protein